MQATAILRNARISAQKVRLVADQVRGLPVEKAEQLLLGQKPTEGLFREAARAATQDLAQDSDIHASADYRRQVSEVLARRALEEAARRALQLEKATS